MQAASCGRCRFEHQGDADHECLHCKLDDLILAWQLRIFDLQTHATNRSNEVTAEDALFQVQPVFGQIPALACPFEEAVAMLAISTEALHTRMDQLV